MATASRATYGSWVTNSQNDRFRAANGSKVNTDGSTTVSVWVGFKKKNDNLGRFPIYRQAKLKCLVGGIGQNIIFVPSVSVDGNSIRIQKLLRLRHVASGLRLDDICNFGGCSWVKLDPAWMYSGSESSAQHGEFVMSEGLNAVHDSLCKLESFEAVRRRLHWKLTECKGMCPMIHVAQSVQEASRHSNIIDAEKVLLKRKCKLTLGF